MSTVPVADVAEFSADEVAGAEGRTAATQALRRDGVVILRGAVRPPLLSDLSAAVDDIYARFLAGDIHNYSIGEETAKILPTIWEDAFTEPRDLQGFRKWNIVDLDKRFIPVVDSDPLYGVVHNAIGPDLSVSKTQLIVLPPSCLDSPFLHTDAGAMADVVESMDASPVMISAQIFLSDLPETEMGNFTCVPGSHHKRFPWSPDNTTRSQLGDKPLGGDIPAELRRQLLVNTGDVALFVHSLWHGANVNRSDSARRSIILAYAKSFVRPYDYETTPAAVQEHGTARQKLLFGDLGDWAWRPGCYYHYPQQYFDALAPDQEPA